MRSLGFLGPSSTSPHRGEIWICRFGPDIGVRPVAVVSADETNETRGKVMVAVGTMQKRNIPTEIPVGEGEGLSREGVVSASDISTVPKGLLIRRVGRLSAQKMQALDNALMLALGFG